MNQPDESQELMEVDPPAAYVCERCGTAEKVTQVTLVSNGWQCSECGYSGYRVDSWERVKDV